MTDAPEFRVALFGFFAAFVWEMWQMPFYRTADLAIMDAVQGCSMGSFGDAGIMVVAYSVAARIAGSRHWILEPRRLPLFVYLGTGLVITIAIEHIALNAGIGWHYSDLMPVGPFGAGLVPVVMWIIVPLATLWLVRLPSLPR